MEKWIVDKIEEEYIVLDNNGNVTSIKKDEIEGIVKEGDVLLKNEEGKFVIDKKETFNRKEYIEELTENLWEN